MAVNLSETYLGKMLFFFLYFLKKRTCRDVERIPTENPSEEGKWMCHSSSSNGNCHNYSSAKNKVGDNGPPSTGIQSNFIVANSKLVSIDE
jgi:hypothetical protein